MVNLEDLKEGQVIIGVVNSSEWIIHKIFVNPTNDNLKSYSHRVNNQDIVILLKTSGGYGWAWAALDTSHTYYGIRPSVFSDRMVRYYWLKSIEQIESIKQDTVTEVCQNKLMESFFASKKIDPELKKQGEFLSGIKKYENAPRDPNCPFKWL